MIYTVWIVTPPNYKHSQCFAEVALSIKDGLVELGHECEITDSSFECRGRTIVLGSHLLIGSASFIENADLPADLVFYNLEQVFTKEYLYLLRGFRNGVTIRNGKRDLEVWDYSSKNIETLAMVGIEAKHLPVGYSPSLTRIEESKVQDIDVTFYGSTNDRRNIILDQLSKRCNLVTAFGVYGKERDDLIARAKIVINIHYYESKIFEIVRCSYLLANNKCVVSEKGVGDDFGMGIKFLDYDSLVSGCMELLSDNIRRASLAKAGFEEFRKRRQSEYLKGVL